LLLTARCLLAGDSSALMMADRETTITQFALEVLSPLTLAIQLIIIRTVGSLEDISYIT